MTAFIDVQIIDGLNLPYVIGAESALKDARLDPVFDDTWQAFIALSPGLSLEPMFTSVAVETMIDLADAIRLGGDEPPNLFTWFTLPCDEADVDTLLPAMQALPMVRQAIQRRPAVVAESVSYGTNPDTPLSLQIRPAPAGVDAIYAWQVAGGTGEDVTIVDIEGGWRLDHDELVSARIAKLSVFGSRDVLHGTAVASLIVGADNGVGFIGVVPNAQLQLVTTLRGVVENVADAIHFAAGALRPGDVLLLEVANPFFPTPTPDILIEFDPAAQAAILFATKRGIVVIEPAGNGKIELDKFPFLAHTRPGSPTFVDSGAIVVGQAERTPTLEWDRGDSSFGTRVDCFAQGGDNLHAATDTARDAYIDRFGGTSGASAIIAGVVASIQGITRAVTNEAIAPADMRRLLRDRTLGTEPLNGAAALIGVMPDLRKITQSLGRPRILPIGAAVIGLDALLIVHLDANNRMVRRHFTLLTGWGRPIATPLPIGDFELTACQPAVNSTDEVNPLPRLVFDAYFVGRRGIHKMFWDDSNLTGDVSINVAPVSSVAQGKSVSAVRSRIDGVVVAAISPAGEVVVMTGDPDRLESTGLSAPFVLDPLGSYRRVDGPSLVSRGDGLADLVAIADNGALTWWTGQPFLPNNTGWSEPIREPTQVEFQPGARPALLVNGAELLVAAVSAEGFLRVTTLDPVTRTIDAPVVVDVQANIDTRGPVALGLAGPNVVVLGVDTDGLL
ncbi:MAG: S8 family serine peptidase, partial [Gemmatimonadaceae bacterium]